MHTILDFNGADYGALADGITDNSQAFTDVQTLMDAGDVLRLPPGVWRGNILLSKPGIKVVGSGQPYYDAASGILKGGTVLIGSVLGNAQFGIGVHDLGCDTTSLPTVQSLITSGGNQNPYLGDVALQQTFSNLSLLGKPTDGHGLLLEVGGAITVAHIRAWGMIHAVAVKVPHVTVFDVLARDIVYSGVIVKSDANEGDVFAVDVDRVDVVNTVAGNSAAVNVQGAAAAFKTYNVIVGKLTARGVQNGVLTSLGTGGVGNVERITVSDCTVEYCGQTGYYTMTGHDINLANVIAANCPTNFRNGSATKVRVINGTSIAPQPNESAGVFDVLHLGNQ